MSDAAPIASYVVLGAAMALAWAVAAKREEHRPIAYLLTLLFGSDLARRALRVLVLGPAREAGEVPFRGAARIAASVDVAIVLAWSAAFAGTALFVFVRRRAWPTAVAWALSSAAIVTAYPVVRGNVLARCYLAAEIASCAVALACAVVWYRRSTERTNSAQAALVILICGEIATLTVWPFGPFDHWSLIRAMNFITYGIVIVIQGGSLWEPKPR